MAVVAHIERVPGVHRVYNLEVAGEHCYYVGDAGVLSHNAGGCVVMKGAGFLAGRAFSAARSALAPAVGRWTSAGWQWASGGARAAGARVSGWAGNAWRWLTGRGAGRVVNEGIYEFISASGKRYVGQSGSISRRLLEHMRSGKLLPEQLGTTRRTEVLGGKIAREIAEQIRILKRGGIDALENIKNPIGPARSHLLPEWARIRLGYP